MPTCKIATTRSNSLVTVKVAGKAKKMCEDCADRARQEAEVAEAERVRRSEHDGLQGAPVGLSDS